MQSTKNLVDNYSVLGIPRGSDLKVIKSAYRTLAMRYHPDHNPGNKIAEEKFKEISRAYEQLKSGVTGADRVPESYVCNLSMTSADTGLLVNIKKRSYWLEPGLRNGDRVTLDKWTSIRINSEARVSRFGTVFTRVDDDLHMDYHIKRWSHMKEQKEVAIYEHPGTKLPEFNLSMKIKDGSTWKLVGSGMNKTIARGGGRGDLYIHFKTPPHSRWNELSSWNDGQLALLSLGLGLGLGVATILCSLLFTWLVVS